MELEKKTINEEIKGGEDKLKGKDAKLVDVLMIFHNEEKFLGPLINCLKRQKYINEIYAINDFSTDSSRAICEQANLKIIDVDTPWNARKLKLAYNLNLGLKQSEAKYILKLDSDMFLPNNYIKKLVNTYENRENKEPRLFSLSGRSINNENRWIKLFSTLFTFYGYGQARLYKRKYLQLIGGFKDDFENKISEDVLTDIIARKYGFYTSIVRKAVCYHLRPYKDNCAVNPENIIFDLVVSMLLREGTRIKEIIHYLKSVLHSKGGIKRFLNIFAKNAFLLFLMVCGEKTWMRLKPSLRKIKKLIN